MKRLKHGLAAVFLVGLTSTAVVVDSGPAQALDIPWEQIGPALALAAPPVIEGGATVGGGAAAAGGGAAVCATGVGCVILAGIGVAALGAYAYQTRDTWWPWMRQQFTTDSADNFVTSTDVKYYDDPITAYGFHCMRATATDPGSWGSTGHVKWSITVTNTESGVCFAPIAYAVDCLGSDGVLRHYNGAVGGGSNWAYQSVNPIDITPCNDGHGGGSANGFSALRAVHFQADQTSTTWNHRQERGFRWGDAGLPATGTMDTELTCRRPDTTTYTRSGQADITSGSIQVPHCDPGDTPVTLTIGARATDGTFYPQSTYDVEGMNAGSTKAAYPDCQATACTYVVKIDGAACVQGTYPCATWTQLYKTAPSRVECFYGPYEVPVADCYWMERVYETGGTPATLPNTDGDPDTYTAPAPAPEPQPSTSSSTSTTAQPTVTDSPTTSPSTSTSPTGTTDPSSTPTSSTGPQPGSAGEPATGDTAGRDCWPNGWGIFNPSEWVLKPLRCAFEPSPQATATRAAELQAKVDAVGVVPLWDAIGANFSALDSGGGCAGPNVHFGLSGVSQDIHPFNACDPPISTAAFYTKSLASVVLVVGGGLAVARAIAAGFGFSFHMGRGGDSDN